MIGERESTEREEWEAGNRVRQERERRQNGEVANTGNRLQYKVKDGWQEGK